MRNWLSVIAALFGAVLLAICATTPPPPEGSDAPPSTFSAMRAMGDVNGIARRPHPSGSADNARVRGWLVGRLRQLGMTVRETSAPMSDAGAERLAKWSRDPARHRIVNIVATLPGGARQTKAVVVMAHYDSVWGSPGAADDGAGVASALEIVRALAHEPRRRPLMVVLTDGEELGLEGGQALFKADPDRGRIGVVVNMETRGGGGRAAMFETGHDNGGMMRLFQHAVSRPSATSLSVLIYELLPNSTDFTPGKARGVQGFNFAFIGRPSLYHSPLATPANLDQGALQDMGSQALDIVRALLNAPELPGKAPNLVFFDAFGWTLVAYPTVAGWLVIGAAVFLFAGAALAGRVSLGDVLRGVGTIVAIVAAAAGLLYAFNLLSGADGPVNYYDRLAAIPRLQAQALLIAVAVVAAALALVRPRGSETGVAVGMALPLLVLGIVLQIIAPTAAFVVAWPLLLAGVGAAAAAYVRLFGQPVAIVAAALGAGYLLGFAFFLLQAIGPDTPSAAALPLALITLLLWPLLPPLSRRAGIGAALLLLGVASGVALSVRLDAVADTVATYSFKS